MIPTKLLPTIFTYLDWNDLLFVVPGVCEEWRRASERNYLWQDQIRKNRNLFTNSCLLEFENIVQHKNQEELNNQRLHNAVNETFCKIGLLIRHCQCRHYSSISSHQLHSEKCDGGIHNNGCNDRQSTVTQVHVGDDTTDLVHEISQHISIFQTIIYFVEKLRAEELESVKDMKSLFQRTVSTLHPHPNVRSAQEFLDSCHQNGVCFFHSIFVNMMKILHKYQERNSMWEREARRLSKAAAELNSQLEEYNRSMQGILFRYSFISRTHAKKFTLKKMFEKGVIVSTLLTNERRKVITFVLAYATHGSYHLTVYIGGKLFDVILLEIADILAKVYNKVMAAWYDNFLLNTANTLRLIERYMLN